MSGGKGAWVAEWTVREDEGRERGWHVYDPEHVDTEGPVVELRGGYDNARIAHLIAAAPELLEALLVALPYVEGALDDPAFKKGAVMRDVRKVRAALASARGESHD